VDIPHDDTVVAWYLQAANTGWHHRAATALTAQIMKSGFFQALRTEQQLGYVVSAFPWRQLEVPGLVMLVQSPSAGAPRVAAAMERFLADLQGGLDEAQYLRHREALVNDIVKPDENLWQRAEFLWQSIAEQQYDFDGREQLASAVRRIDRADWARYFNRVFLDEARTLQVIAPGSQGALPSGADALYRDAQAVRDAHGVYLVK